MSSSNIPLNGEIGQSIHTVQIVVEIRPTEENGGAIKAHADVTVILGSIGAIKIFSYTIFHLPDKPLWVKPPEIKGKTGRFFPILLLSGMIRRLVDIAVKDEYQRCCPSR
jgi:hypothetical protein